MTLKTQQFKEELQAIAQMAKVLSHPARLAILQYLASKESCMSGDIAEELPLSRTTVSQHLQELKKMGLIKGSIDGTKVNYCIDYQRLSDIKQHLNLFFDGVNQCPKNLDCDC